MPFVAIGEDGRRYISYELEPTRYRCDWICPHCAERMLFVDTHRRIKHFRHFTASGICASYESESREHLELKRFVYERLKRLNYMCTYEKRLGNAIADIVVLAHSTILLPIECQVSPISNYEVNEKLENYRKVGTAQPMYILYAGKNFLKEDKRYAGGVYRLKDVELQFEGRDWWIYYERDNLWRAFFKRKFRRGYKQEWDEEDKLCLVLRLIKHRERIDLKPYIDLLLKAGKQW